jgi:glycosyltransferase involved in cell wall biosynthesis
MGNKKRVLFVGEASYLATGFSTYWNEVIQRLHATNKFEIAEQGSYAQDGDPRNAQVPWKFYSVKPHPQDKEATRIYDEDLTRGSRKFQFGEWRFNDVCLNFKPDIVCGIRDWWMDEFIFRSTFRDKFKFIWMPTIDGIPQKPMWLDDYKLCDGILTYSKWGMNVLKKDGRAGTNLLTVASPGADLNVFKPVENKREHKGKLGIDPNSLIVGTVMRNQKRKLYYDLIEAFSQWLYKSKSKGHLELANRTFLYLHTSYPDQGWDIGAAVKEFNISNKVIMTYLCKECRTAFPAMFSGDITHCRKCNKFCAIPPNAGMHCPRNVLSDIINTFDLYVQYSICEGFGMPCVEAMACGVPIAAVRYSAMEDHLKCPTSIPIEVGRFFREAVVETEQRRALPDNQDFVRKLDVFLKKSEEQKRDLSRKTRQHCIEPIEVYGQEEKLPRYSWDRTAKIWEHIIDQCDIHDNQQTWYNSEPCIHKPHMTPEKLNLSNAEFIRWLIGDVWNHPERCGTYFEGEWIRILNCGFRREGPNMIPMDRKKILEHFLSLVDRDNQQELRRVGRMKTEDPDKIHAMLM